MKRIVCIILAVLMLTAALSACGQSQKTTVVTDSGTTIEVDSDNLTFVSCICTVDGGAKTTLSADKAAELFKIIEKLKGDEQSSPESGGSVIELTFIVAQGYAGYYHFYDNGVMCFSPSPKLGEVKWYSYNSSEYNNILTAIGG